MGDYQWGWLLWKLLQVFGFSLILISCGFGVERAAREGKPFLWVLEKERWVDWMAVGAVLITVSLFVLGANWVQKTSAIGFSSMLLVLVWQVRREGQPPGG